VTGAAKPTVFAQAPSTLITGALWNSQFGAVASWYLGAPMIVWRQLNAQPLSTSSWAALNWDTIDLDTHATRLSASPSKFTAPYAGWHAVSAQCDFVANPTGQRTLKFVVNGTASYNKLTSNAVNGADTALAICAELYLNAGDFLEVWVWQNCGGTLNTGETDGVPRFTARWVHN
jgi:hypothetical protein